MTPRKAYWLRALLGLDQLFNVVIFNGDEDETISSNFGKRSGGNWVRKFIDMWFGKGHCERSIEADEGEKHAGS